MKCTQGYELEDEDSTKVALIVAICFGTLCMLGGIIYAALFFVNSKTTLEGKPHTKLIEYKLSHSIDSHDVKNIYLTSYKDRSDRFNYRFTDAITNSCDRNWYSDACSIEIYIDDRLVNSVSGKAKYVQKKWGDRISGRPNSISPEFSVEIPISKDYLYKYLDIKVYMTVHYPYQGGNFVSRDLNFENRRERLENSFRLFVVSPDEIDYKSYLDNKISTPIKAIISILTGLGLLVFSITKYRKMFC